MTDQSSNDQFHASSFMQGRNAEYKIGTMEPVGIVVIDSHMSFDEAVLKAIG